MTTTVRGAVRERAAEAQEQGGGEQERPFEWIYPLLVATLMSRREEGEGIQHPLLLDALAARREEGEGIQHPLLLAALMARREEREKEMV